MTVTAYEIKKKYTGHYNIFRVRVCNLSYTACALLFCHLWPVRLYHVFPQYLINGTIFGSKLLTIKFFFYFRYRFVWNIAHSKNNSARYCHKRTDVIIQSIRYFCQILTKLEFSRQIVETHSYIKFRENPSIGSRVVPCGQLDRRTDRYDEDNSPVLQFCEHA
jgi:hypothetical protein